MQAAYSPDIVVDTASSTDFAATAPVDTTFKHAIHLRSNERILRLEANPWTFFLLWVKNFCLILLTLGLYAPWAKVSEMRYLHQHTRLYRDGLCLGNFDYHANPMAILKGRLLLMALLLGTAYAGWLQPGLDLVISLVAYVFFPLGMWQILRYKMANTSFAGIRFGFKGTVRQAVQVFVVLPLLTFLSLGLLFPYTYMAQRRYFAGNAMWGRYAFKSDMTVWDYYRWMALWLILSIICIVSLSFLIFQTVTQVGVDSYHIWLVGVISGVTAVALWKGFIAINHRILWRTLSLAGKPFACRISVAKFVFMSVLHTLLILMTFGLFTPFAKLHSLKYRLDSVTLPEELNVADIIHGEQEEQSPVLSEAVAGVVDFAI